MRRPAIDRVSADDLMALVAERGSAPMQVGVLLLLDATDLDPEEAIRQLGRRVAGVPRLRQRLWPVPVGCGRPIWLDDPGFDLDRHVSVLNLPGESLAEPELLRQAAALLAAPLPRDRPLWAARLVTTDEGPAALVLVIHHVLADGIGGLAVLGGLVDGADPAAPTPGFPRARPTPGAIWADSVRQKAAAARSLVPALLRLAAAAGQLRRVGTRRLARSSLNVPTGPRRQFASIRLSLAQTLAVARAEHATVNDVLLVACAGALHRLLAARGERVEEFVVSVPFSARRQTGVGRLGNRSGVIPLGIPAVGDPGLRLRRVAALTRTARSGARGASTALLGPVFRLLARLGLYRRFINRQRLIHTFLSNLRGPTGELSIFGRPITAMLPLSAPTGNVTVAFTVLSYAGTLVITVVADPDACPDLPLLRAALAEELAGFGLRPVTATGRAGQMY